MLLLQEQSANAAMENSSSKPVEEAVCKGDTMLGAGSYNIVPVTGISCSLIDELPTMALPMPEMMLLPSLDIDIDLESFDVLM